MAKVKVPVSINGIEFDALISEDRSFEASVPEYSVEEGFSVSDAIIIGAEKLSMTLFVTNTPVTWYKRHGASMSRVKEICGKLETLFLDAIPVTVVTNDAVYKSMAIESITFSKTVEQGYAREIPISFKKIGVTKAKTTTIPASYGKSGATGEPAGAANTNTGSGGDVAANNNEGQSKSSILYNVAASAGIIS